MSIETLPETASALVAPGKGILAIDESSATIARRFAEVGIHNSEANRRAYRELLLTAPGLGEWISGVILYDETIRQSTGDGVPFARYLAEQGIVPGIKVDKGTQPLAGCPGEVVTEGLDGLRPRLEEYYKLGARFAKWRAVIHIGDDIPTGTCIESNSHALARFAALCQEQGLVPMVEPEVLMGGDHDLDASYEVHLVVLRSLFIESLEPLRGLPKLRYVNIVSEGELDLEPLTSLPALEELYLTGVSIARPEVLLELAVDTLVIQ